MTKTAKKPLQVYLRADQLDALRALAKRRGESMAGLIRVGVDNLLQEVPPEEDPLLEVIGLFDSGIGDLSEKHDEYIAQMIEEENQSGA
ncbi:MAG: CopG family transcriptional regulator [Chloroflexota bacterium]|nr:CopG family transcriptional regulator [Chloroflexota bacterium]